ncbi:MAG: RNA polymerase sigma factor [Armatimonadota bacterium]
MSDSEEGRLLARAQRGDMLAFESLVHMHQQRVYAHCYRMLNNSAEAEDLASETFLRAYQHLGSLRAEPSIVFWLLRVANNLGISMLRKRSTRPEVELEALQEQASDIATPEEQTIELARRDVVKQCLQQLAPQDRTAVLMFYLEERPLEEIAKVLGCGVAGAKSRVHRARHKLREYVMAELGEDVFLPVKKEGEA